MVVVGSAEHGMLGQVVVGSTADRLLHTSPIPVAVATRGYRAPPRAGSPGRPAPSARDEASRSALDRTAEMCAETGASLRVATFGVPGADVPPEVRGEHQVLDAFVADTSQAQEAAVAAFRAPARARDRGRDRARLARGAGRLDWQDGDVLVVGSSPTGILARVFIGTNATRIVRHSPVPAVVVPR